MQRWSYTTAEFKLEGWTRTKFDSPAFEAKLNELGQDGWELVSVFDTNGASGGTLHVLAVFKRPA